MPRSDQCGLGVRIEIVNTERIKRHVSAEPGIIHLHSTGSGPAATDMAEWQDPGARLHQMPEWTQSRHPS